VTKHDGFRKCSTHPTSCRRNSYSAGPSQQSLICRKAASDTRIKWPPKAAILVRTGMGAGSMAKAIYSSDLKEISEHLVDGDESALDLGFEALPKQEPTIEESKQQGSPLPQITLERMETHTVQEMAAKDRLAWYQRKLGGYIAQINASAKSQKIPPDLLAVVVLNELAQINWIDELQEAWKINGSIGIAQIQVDTALAHGLTSEPGDDELVNRQAAERHALDLEMAKYPDPPPRKTLAEYKALASWNLCFERLRTPQYAIEAAAREIRRLLKEMADHKDNPWQKRLDFSLPSIDDLTSTDDAYFYVKGTSLSDKARNLAQLVAAAYNSPGIVAAVDENSITPGAEGFRYPGAVIHGNNAWELMKEIFALTRRSRNELLLDSSWAGRVVAIGDIFRYSKDNVTAPEYSSALERRAVIKRHGKIRIVATARNIRVATLKHNFLADFYERSEDEISDDMVPKVGPITIRVYSEMICRLQEGFTNATSNVYDDFIEPLAHQYTVDWSDYEKLPPHLLLVEGGYAVNLSIDTEQLSNTVVALKASRPDLEVDDELDLEICWYISARDMLGEKSEFCIANWSEHFLMRVA